jgi:aminotransferase
MKFTIIIISENKPGVLYRISDLFLRRKINIESLTVAKIGTTDLSRFTVVVDEPEDVVRKLVQQVDKVIEVIRVTAKTDEDLVFAETCLVKVTFRSAEEKDNLIAFAQKHLAHVIYSNHTFLVLEKSGDEAALSGFYEQTKILGEVEYVESGRIALEKNPPHEATTGSFPVADIPVSAIKQMQLLATSEKDVISLAQGIPYFSTPEHIKQAAIQAIESDLVGKYSSGFGILPLREAIVEKLRVENKIQATIDNVLVTHGAIEGSMAALLALFHQQDEIILLTPAYASHLTQVQIAFHGKKAVCVPLRETNDGWKLDVSKIEAAITPATKAILFSNPCNPTGKVYAETELKLLAALAVKYDLFIIADEMYEYFVYDDKKHISIASFPEVADRTISLFGFSKSYAMTGWRVGYLVANESLIKQIFKAHDSLVTCPTVVSQYAALEALRGAQNIRKTCKNTFSQHRKIVSDGLHGIEGVSVIQPEGAYYAFVKFDKSIDDTEFVQTLLKEARVAVVPGSAFGSGGENHIRISFGGEEETLREGVRRIRNFLEGGENYGEN